MPTGLFAKDLSHPQTPAHYFTPEELRLQCGAEFVAGGGVEVDTSDSIDEWNEYIWTNPAKIRLGTFKTYKVSYDYTIQKVGGKDSHFYTLLKSVSMAATMPGGIGGEWWTDRPGKSGHREIEFQTDAVSDYHLLLGMQFQGAIHIDNLKIQLMADNRGASGMFSGETLIRGISCTLRNNARFVKGGIEVDTTQIPGDWHEFYQTKSPLIKFTPGRTYQFDFDYLLKTPNGDTSEFFAFLRDANDNDHKNQAFQKWLDNGGCSGHKSFTFTIPGPNAFEFCLGISKQGLLRIENIKIKELD